MLFNSFEFLFVFLPIVFIGCAFIERTAYSSFRIHLILISSLLFYSWCNIYNVPILLASVIFNYFLASLILKSPSKYRKLFLSVTIAINLLYLGAFKYYVFVVEDILQLGTVDNLYVGGIPLGISFFTFQQIIYLCEKTKGEIIDDDFFSYLSFVCFFPQLIAGPIVHYKNLVPMLRRPFARDVIQSVDVNEYRAIGLIFLIVGLFKKVILSGIAAYYTDPIYEKAAASTAITFYESWIAGFGFYFQIYFDFSGYCDMAIGAALLLGVILPINFFSPYRAVSIAEFWRRWHITLSRFFLEYLYIPLGGNRKGHLTTLSNLIIVMGLVGLWHGAGWTFIIWGLFHGVLLSCHRLYEIIIRPYLKVSPAFAFVLTQFVVMVGWVFFRSPDIPTASNILYAMFGGVGIDVPLKLAEGFAQFGIKVDAYGVAISQVTSQPLLIFLLMFILVSSIPNLYQTLRYDDPYLASFRVGENFSFFRFQWPYAVALSLMMVLSVLGLLEGPKEFIYFQF